MAGKPSPGLSRDHGPLKPITAMADVGNPAGRQLASAAARFPAAGLWPTYIRVPA